jgi:2-dehydro-3-deoxygluconokinase
MSDLITLGETMAAFAPESAGALRYISGYRIRIAGAESNVAIGLAKLGLNACWISRLGQDEFGCYVRNQLRAEGVDCSQVSFDPAHRTGVMFKEIGAGETSVYYYRENSAASHMDPSLLPEALFRQARILHLTGITPVLSDSCRDTVLAAVDMAHRNGLLVSFDPNVRQKLWGGRDYVPLLRQLTLDSEIVLLGQEEAQLLFGVQEDAALCRLLFRSGKCRYVCIKKGARGAVAADAGQMIPIPPHPCRCIEPIGAGDGFNAGFLAGILQGKPLETAGRMAAVCGALATQVVGDTEGYPDRETLDRILAGAGTVYR